MNASKIADNVFAAFLSAFFSIGFFFFLTGFVLPVNGSIVFEPASCLVITFGFNGMRMSAKFEGRRLIGCAAPVRSERRPVIAAGAVLEKCSGIILIDGPSPPAPSQSAAGSRINIV